MPYLSRDTIMLNAQEIYHTLLRAYGKPQWWSDNPYQVMVEAVLVQHTAWSSVEKIRAVLAGKLSPTFIQALSSNELQELIHPCGFQKAKARTIKEITEWFMQYGCDVEAIRTLSLESLRAELLALRGVGAETADVILVYAFHQPSFIVDAYTRILLQRLGYSFVDDAEVRGFFEQGISKDAEIYGSYHWLILEHNISRCKKKPLCAGCPFSDCVMYDTGFS